MEKRELTFIGIAVIAGFVFLAMMNAFFISPPKINASATPSPQIGGELQVINLTASGLSYKLDKQTVQAGRPVRIVADVSTLQGCLQSFVFPQFNVRKVFTPQDNSVEFVPTQKGTFPFSCSMGMGRGTLTVV